MISNKLKILSITAVALVTARTSEASDVFEYRKGSLYSIMINHSEYEYSDELVSVYKSIDIPDIFYDHSLPKTVFNAPIVEEAEDMEQVYIEGIARMLNKNDIAKRLVIKWFDIKKDGTSNFDLILNRGYDNVTASDLIKTKNTVRGTSDIVYNAGMDLMSNTYVLVNDINYGDKRDLKDRRMAAAIGASIALSTIPLVGAYIGAAVGSMASDYSGFKVTVTSYLFRLVWDEDVTDGFYQNYYSDYADPAKYAALKADKEMFKLRYIGSQTVTSSKWNLSGVNNREPMIRKICTRAIDKSIAQLMKTYPEFRISTPLISTQPLMAHIGLKEDVTPDSKFEVLEVSIDEKGKATYSRQGIIRPIKGRIWDNRYLADMNDDNFDPSLSGTMFEVVSGSNFYPGMLIREITQK